MRQIEAASTLLFDLDGTLLDTAPDLTAAVNHARKKLLSLPPVRDDALRPLVAQGTGAMVAFALDGATDIVLADDFRHVMLDFYSRHLADKTRPYEGIPELLDYLDVEKSPWGVVTNKMSHFAIPILDQLHLSSRSACIVCADMAAQAKPAPDTLLLAAKRLGLSPEKCAYVGDAETDMRAAKNAGMLAIAAEWGYLSDEDKVDNWPLDLRFSTPRELHQWIKQ